MIVVPGKIQAVMVTNVLVKQSATGARQVPLTPARHQQRPKLSRAPRRSYTFTS